MKLALIGKFPNGVTEQMIEQLNGRFDVCVCEDPSKIEQFQDAELMVLKGSGFTQRSDFEKTPQLRYLQKWGVGLDKVDIAAAGELGIAVANVPGGNAYTVAELAVLHMLNLLRHFAEHNSAMHRGIWTKTAFAKNTFNLRGKLVGLVGGGNIGRLVAERVRVFGATVQYYDAFRLAPEVEASFGMKYVSLDELLKSSDIVSLHIPLTPETHHIIDAEAIAKMKDGAYLINTARGGLVDEAALAEALRNGKLGGAGIDCIEHEPLDENDLLLSYDNVSLTPHIGGTSADLPKYMVPMIVKDLCDFADGKEVRSIANRKYLNK